MVLYLPAKFGSWMVLGEKEPLLIWLMMCNLDIWICRSLLSCIHGIQWLRNHWRSVFHELVNELNLSMKRKPIINCFFLLTSWLAYVQFQICWYRISSTRFVISCRPTTWPTRTIWRQPAGHHEWLRRCNCKLSPFGHDMFGHEEN